MKKIMIVNTSHHQFDGFDKETGLWLSELVHFYDVFHNDPDYQVDLYNIKGGETPLDPVSLNRVTLDTLSRSYYENNVFMHKLKHLPAVSEADPSQYDVIYFTGGHGVMYDFTGNPYIEEAVNTIYDNGGIISSVCHGTCALLEVKRPNHRFFIDGKTLTGFSNVEEILANRKKYVPFALETALKVKEAKYRKSKIPMKGYIEVEGQLITGQNPASAKLVAQAVKEALA
ncbi:type 1 glutamine amidotransferase domain-containing protein [Staphylococcus felis]|uniref:type 1 glutamine amidotransferase domain-containing protein n=1 Tax=Staphylococcus felis TaxID=46127 RepID=UPI000E282252|nr:type 1 glutamine amidotransferase domain-containing protein [Staphylococcus felis]REH80641.1 type 1 glutamine amidotransferase domain-containing protein [Staphylococcus felis]REH97196.1 type 1 glutamine amidotransferase domain-containing protein [Staphylococcus felis]REH97788.1 type 1 glutamine amidotransferase domain-containing protein [Staphylococcus felis]REI06452.1 type 1 glutamine amidotransferase domain-containing protein [Staphylococcus felis]REI18192.1 type 1 glutamine amidotransfer